jgi:hypothetical protein
MMSLRGGSCRSNLLVELEIASGKERPRNDINIKENIMREFLNILKDVKSGALPLSEVPGFMLWAVGKRIWWLLMVILAAALFWREKR